MPPPQLIDPATLDFSKIIAGPEEIGKFNPQRFEFALLDAIILADREANLYAGYHDVRPDAWWTRGHIPGRPLMPGVLMIEAAAQLASYVAHLLLPDLGFVGFGGVDGVKFRDAITPSSRFIIVGQPTEVKRRRVTCTVQGFVAEKMVFEGIITGMPV